MKTFEFLSWKKNIHECGVRFYTTINQPEIFLEDYGIQFKVVDSNDNVRLTLTVTKWRKNTKWNNKTKRSESIGLSKDHAERGFITGNDYQIRAIMNSLGFATIGNPVVFRNNLIEDLKDEISYLKSSVDNLTSAIEKLKQKETVPQWEDL